MNVPKVVGYYWFPIYFIVPEPRKESIKEETPEPRVAEPMVVEEEEILNYIDTDETVVVFKRQSGKSLKATNVDKNLDDDFFDLTIEDAMRIQVERRSEYCTSLSSYCCCTQAL